MIRVAIADDEKMIREGLRDAFSWEDEGFELVGICKNGEEAYTLAKDMKPDIFLLDICMPKLSGLELIEKLNDVLPDMLSIIITGYSEFEYAHKAIQLGVYDYVVKPIDEERLWQLLMEARDTLLSHRKQSERNSVMKQQLDAHLETMQSDFVGKLVTRGFDDALRIREELTHLKLDFGNSPGLLLVRHISHVSGKKQWSQQLLEFAYKNLIMETVLEVGKSAVLTSDLDGQVIALVNVKDDEEWVRLEKKLEGASRLYLGQQCRVATKWVSPELMDCHEMYDELDRLLDVGLSDNVLAVKRIVEEEFGDSELDLNLIAERLSVSNSYLSRQVNKELGISFKEYLIDIRMNKAKELIQKTDLRINEIAERVGYANQHYFARAFRKLSGLSPSQYRAKD